MSHLHSFLKSTILLKNLECEKTKDNRVWCIDPTVFGRLSAGIMCPDTANGSDVYVFLNSIIPSLLWGGVIVDWSSCRSNTYLRQSILETEVWWNHVIREQTTRRQNQHRAIWCSGNGLGLYLWVTGHEMWRLKFLLVTLFSE
jgi:hypothetical protein